MKVACHKPGLGCVLGSVERLAPAVQEEWLPRLRNGDPRAFDDLYALFSQPTFRYLLHQQGRRDVAEDLHQEAWVAIAKNLRRLRDDSDLAAWVFTIVRNKLRSWQRWAVLQARLFVPLVSDGTTVPHETGHLQEAFARLRPAEREVLLLACVEALSTEQVARTLGLRPDAVRQRLARARVALAKVLKEGSR